MDVHRIISLFLIYFTFCPCISYGQQYPIPGATQQATWVFSIFFEEASGKKILFISVMMAHMQIISDVLMMAISMNKMFTILLSTPIT
ncbi:MAG: hypothetical protein IPK08_06335 [Bacteroidetes bacterium]|nr:hypothetical protein [Bacteroidota bacterium]